MNDTVCIVGGGVVGKTIADAFISSGFDVTINDLSVKRVEFLCSSGYNATCTMPCSSVYVIAVPTMAYEGVTSVAPISAVINEIMKQPFVENRLVVLESTVGIGQTRLLTRELVGVCIAFSPERVDPGRTSPEYKDIPKIVSGINRESLIRVTEVYSRVFPRLIEVSSLETAEAAKLLENSYRAVNIAFINEFADACEDLVDVHDVIAAASTKPFGFHPFTPSIGVGGACIAHDPYFLLSTVNTLMPLLDASMDASAERPYKIAKKDCNATIDQMVLVVGVGYKPGSSDYRESPVTNFIKSIKAKVYYFDPFISDYPHAEQANMDTMLFDEVHVMYPYKYNLAKCPVKTKYHCKPAL